MGGDYKFLLMVLGMAGATSNHACIYCKIHTDDRRDMSKAHDFLLPRKFGKNNRRNVSKCIEQLPMVAGLNLFLESHLVKLLLINCI